MTVANSDSEDEASGVATLAETTSAKPVLKRPAAKVKASSGKTQKRSLDLRSRGGHLVGQDLCSGTSVACITPQDRDLLRNCSIGHLSICDSFRSKNPIC